MAELDFEAPFAEGLKRLTELRAYRGDPGKATGRNRVETDPAAKR